MTNASSSSKRHSLRKAERLIGRKNIDLLFANGQHLVHGPLSLIWIDLPESDTPFKVLFSAPKVHFKRAVDRNVLKRRMREAYRISKDKLPARQQGRKVALAFVYHEKTISDFESIRASVGELLTQLEAALGA